MEDLKFCYLKFVDLPDGVLSAASVKGKYWKTGENITFFLEGGSSTARQRILTVFQEISGFTSLKFTSSSKQSADLRISFVRGAGSWSYIGTDALLIPENRSTMNIGWEDSSLGVYRHEIGHALGLIHEHQSPAKGIKWNRDQVIKDLSGPPNNWSVAQIEHNVLNAADPNKTNYTSFDSESVMLYSFPSSWTLDGVGTKDNPNWSDTDKKHLGELYPRPDLPTAEDAMKVIFDARGSSEYRMYTTVWKDIAKYYGLSTSGSKRAVYNRVKNHVL